MPRKKNIRYQELKNFTNIFSYPVTNDSFNWSNYFANNNPIELELGCGNGDFCLQLAQLNNHINYIGVDIKGHRLHQAATYALKNNLKNICFIRTQIQFIDSFFIFEKVQKIWLIFPDPHIHRKEKLRLTHPKYLDIYKKIIHPNCPILLKTDSLLLYQYTLNCIVLLNLPLIFSSIHCSKSEPIDQDFHLLSLSSKFEKLNISGSKQNFFLKFKIYPNFEI